MEVESNNTIEVLARHPAGHGCPLEGNSILYFWKEEDWRRLGIITIIAAAEIMFEIAGEKRCSHGCGARYKAFRDTDTLILKYKPTLCNFDSYYRMVESV